jgi:hypothetical protein
MAALRDTAEADSQQILVEHLLVRFSPARFESALEDSPELAAIVSSLLAERLTLGPAPLVRQMTNYLGAAARSRANRLGRRGGPWSNEELDSVLRLQFVDPQRFVSDERFRATVLNILPQSIDRETPRELRELLLFSINNVPGIDFESSEAIESAWGVVARRSDTREVDYDSLRLFFPDGDGGRIAASVYSLPSAVVDRAEAALFLTKVRESAPGRTLVVLADLPFRMELETTAARLKVHLIETFGRRYSAWPRDPFSLVRDENGGAVLLLRPNEQRGRDEDNFLGRELVQGLPESVDREWGGVRWTRSPVPFHNGQVLFTRERAWVSIHSLEPHILDILELERVPVENFGERSAWLAYVEGAKLGARQLEALYGRDVVFVHDLFEREGSEELIAATQALGGGAGFDLDSLVTFVELDAGPPHALVGDLDDGIRLLNVASASELAHFARAFGIEPTGEALRRSLTAAQRTSRARGLDAFLDLISRHLSRLGIPVSRLPLFFVPVGILASRSEFRHEDFLITWNNVVVESVSGVHRAEGFSQHLSSGDDRARLAFRENGYELELFPPLVRSVVLQGGYRCASQHLRAAERPTPAGLDLTSTNGLEPSCKPRRDAE